MIMKMIGQTHKQPHVTVAGAKVLNRKGKELQNLDPENKNTIISDKHVRKIPANASLTKQQGPKSTSQPGSTITVSQRLTGCRIQCDRAHPTPLSFSAQLPNWYWNLNGIVYWGTQSIH
jgi:hypothetical protein